MRCALVWFWFLFTPLVFMVANVVCCYFVVISLGLCFGFPGRFAFVDGAVS